MYLNPNSDRLLFGKDSVFLNLTICLFQVRLLSKKTPRYLISFSYSPFLLLFIVRTAKSGYNVLVDRMTSAFSVENLMLSITVITLFAFAFCSRIIKFFYDRIENWLSRYRNKFGKIRLCNTSTKNIFRTKH